MVVYGEYLFLENFITGVVMLYLTARMTGCGYKRWRTIAGGFVSGGCGFLIFLPLGPAEGMAIRLLMALAVTALALGREALIKKTAVFLILTTLSGGAVMALLLWQGTPSLLGNGVLYMGAVTYGKVLLFGAGATGLCMWFISLVKQQRRQELTTGEVTLEACGRTCRLRAFVDTGNALKEPMTGKPVILIDEKGRAMADFEGEAFQARAAAVPYEAVGVRHGILMGIRLDRMEFNGKHTEGVVLAYYEGRFQGFEVLLNQEILEGGLLEHGLEDGERIFS